MDVIVGIIDLKCYYLMNIMIILQVIPEKSLYVLLYGLILVDLLLL